MFTMDSFNTSLDGIKLFDKALVSDDLTLRLAQESNKLINIPEFIEYAINIKGHPFSFKDRRYLLPVYASGARHKVLKTARQCEKSTTLAFYAIGISALIPNFSTLYVSPVQSQMRTFSITRVKEAIDTSPFIQKWVDKSLTYGVQHKQFANRSQLLLLYASLSAERIRGNSADLILLDERQDILPDNIPIILECASHSSWKLRIDSGTPKTVDNSLETEWKHSTQFEWLVPCNSCGGGDYRTWNLLGEKNIGKKFLICGRCGKQLFPDHPDAKWASLNPGATTEGYHISQLMVPWVDWHDLLNKYEGPGAYSRAKFMNEVLGISYDSSTRPLTSEDVKKNCDPNFSISSEGLRAIIPRLAGRPVFAGIDWGGGSMHSYTFVTLGAYIDDKFTIFYAHRFTGPESEPTVAIAIIEKLLKSFNVTKVGADFGGGYYPNAVLTKSLGSSKYYIYQYLSPKKKISWSKANKRFYLNRTEVMTDMFNAIKRGDVFRFPRWEDFELCATDMTSIHSEYNESTFKMEYDKSGDHPDDGFHSLLYCFLASQLVKPRGDVFR